jgi:predicted MFS family arabinose efflux permease
VAAAGDTPDPSWTGAWARRTFASLRHATYRRFFVGHLVSLTGFWMRIAAQGWLVWELTHRKDDLGAITAIDLVPFVVLAPLGGILADRHDRRWLLFWMQAIAAVANVAIGLDVLVGHVAFWHVAVTALVVGCARAIEFPVRQALVQDLVGRDDRSNAIGLNAAGFQLARVVGPSLGALALWLVGTGPCFLLVAVCVLANAAILPGLVLQEVPPGPRTVGMRRQLAEGFRYVAGHRRTRTLLTLVFLAFVGLWPYQSLLPALADHELGIGASGYALLLAATGFGALLGALWVAGRSSTMAATRNVVFGLVWAGAVCVAAVGLTRSWEPAVPELVVAGFCQVAFVATANTMVQESAPDDLRGRVMGIWAFVFGASYPLGSFVMGRTAERYGMTWTFAGGAALVFATTLLVRLRTPPRSTSPAAPEREDVAPVPAGPES